MFFEDGFELYLDQYAHFENSLIYLSEIFKFT